MNVTVNEEHLKQELGKAQKQQRFGTVSLVIVFLVACPLVFLPGNSPWQFLIFVAYVFLLIGFPLWISASNRVRQYKRVPRPDQIISNELKALSAKYTLHHYAKVNGRLIKHLVVGPRGLAAIETRELVGPVSCRADRWSVKSRILDVLTGTRPRIGNPTRDLNEQAEALRGLLAENGKPNVPVLGLVVFVLKNDLIVSDCTYPAVPLDEMRAQVRTLLAESEPDSQAAPDVSTRLTSEDRRKLNTLLAPARPARRPAAPAAQRSGTPR